MGWIPVCRECAAGAPSTPIGRHPCARHRFGRRSFASTGRSPGVAAQLRRRRGSRCAGMHGDSAERPIGRDQIWIAEKADDGASRIYSLVEFSPRQDEALSRRYLQGRYGGLPVIDPSGFERAAEPVRELASA